MKYLILFLLLSLPTIAKAQAVVVTSGEHDGFSRLVFTFPKPTDWRLQREEKGYLFSAQGFEGSFDLSQVYRRLSKDRVIDISVGTSLDGVSLKLDCECYALPFDFRPGIVVVDIKDGVAPLDSAFEVSAENIRLAPLKESDFLVQKAAVDGGVSDDRSFVGLSAAISSASRLATLDQFTEPNAAALSLDATRDDLIWQLSRGATAGLVDVVENLDALVDQPKGQEGINNFRISAEPGITADPARRLSKIMTGEGRQCFTNEQLDVLQWFDELDSLANRAFNPMDLVGEFDQPKNENVEKAIKSYLAYGFGAEARMLLQAFPANNDSFKIWESMSYILDLESSEIKVFGGMEICDTAASMWAVLESEAPVLPSKIATPAILRTFSALPLHLRRHLGPSLAERFISQDDYPTSRAINDAILRAPGGPDASLEMLDATIDLAQGDIEGANETLSPLSGSSGPVGIKAAVELIMLQVEMGQVVPLDLSITAEALLHEARGGGDEPSLLDALSLAYASQDRFGDAFGIMGSVESASAPIWNLLAKQGSESSILNYGVLDERQKKPTVSQETATLMAERLSRLGFQEAASLWLQNAIDESQPAMKQTLILAAEIAFERADYNVALSYLDQLDEVDTTEIRGRVLLALDDEEAIGQLSGSEKTKAEERMAKRRGDWTKVSTLTEEPVWKDATRLTEKQPSEEADQSSTGEEIVTTQSSTEQPLAASRRMLEESLMARSVLESLLSLEEVSLEGS